MKKIVFYIILSLLTFGIFTSVEASSSSDLFLNHLDFQVQINQDGSMQVSEKWNIKIQNTNTLYKTFQIDKSKYSSIKKINVKDITNGNEQTLVPFNQWAYHLPKGKYFGGMNQKNEFEIAWGVGLDNSSATKIYQISYQVEDAITKYKDYAELYWQFVGKDFEINAKNITGTILLPNQVSNKDMIKVWGHTEDLNGEIYVTDTNKIEFNINSFRAGRYIEIRSLFPSEMITTTNRVENTNRLEQVIQEESKWANQANARRKMKEEVKNIINIIINIVGIGLSILFIKFITKTISKIKTTKKILPTQEITYYREIPKENTSPATAIAILTKQIEGISNNSITVGRIFSSTLLDLSLKKIIAFEAQDKIITIEILQEDPEELQHMKEEKVIFDFIKEASKQKQGKITTKDLEKYIRKSSSKIVTLSNVISQNTKQRLYQENLVNKKEKEERTKLSVYIILLIFMIVFSSIGLEVLLVNFSILSIGIIPLILTSIVLLVVISILVSKLNVFTQKGVDENAKWKGLKKYMEDFSMLDKKEVPELILWEKFLVYATAFGIADKVLKQLKLVYPNIKEEWNNSNYGCLYLMMNTNFSTSFSNAVSTSIASTYSSATGGGGGFSGGGRWPEDGRRRRWWKIRIHFLIPIPNKRRRMKNHETRYVISITR